MMKIGTKDFDLEHETYIMGILNITPDSFSDGGCWNNLDAALKHTEEMISAGAAIIDIGGESTRPGYTKISDEEEISRVAPVIRAVKEQFDIPVSVDTYKSKVAQAALEAGADLVNDIWGLKYDPDLAGVIARAGVPCCLMHNRERSSYDDYLADIQEDLRESIRIAHEAGIGDEQIILDPGIGFGKNYEQNLQLMHHLEVVSELGYPVLLGTSRKSMIGLTLNLPKNEREEGTLVTTVMAVQKHMAFVRVHDVEKNRRAIVMTKAILSV
jgi:dihydropteroate synthase